MADYKGATKEVWHAFLFGAGALAGAVVTTAIAKALNINYGFQGRAYDGRNTIVDPFRSFNGLHSADSYRGAGSYFVGDINGISADNVRFSQAYS